LGLAGLVEKVFFGKSSIELDSSNVFVVNGINNLLDPNVFHNAETHRTRLGKPELALLTNASNIHNGSVSNVASNSKNSTNLGVLRGVTALMVPETIRPPNGT
jgi:hypothetical protein